MTDGQERDLQVPVCYWQVAPSNARLQGENELWHFATIGHCCAPSSLQAVGKSFYNCPADITSFFRELRNRNPGLLKLNRVITFAQHNNNYSQCIARQRLLCSFIWSDQLHGVGVCRNGEE